MYIYLFSFLTLISIFCICHALVNKVVCVAGVSRNVAGVFVKLDVFLVMLHVFPVTLQETRATSHETRATLHASASASAEYTKPQ